MLRGGRRSSNIEDRRGGGGMAIGGGIGAVVLALLAYLFGVDPSSLPQDGPGASVPGTERQANPAEDSLADFVSMVLASTEDIWTAQLPSAGRNYEPPTLVMFTNQTQSSCGTGVAAMGPFYCPLDRKVYIDLSFYRALRERLGAPGDFAQAYVIAHEVGHHVQNLLGIAEQVHARQERASKREANDLSVRMELQADFLAGVWAHHAERKGILEPGDIQEALNAASMIGDDKLQQESQGRVIPDSFTHGSSEQRVRWFKKGYESGDIRQGDTFGVQP